jgi:acetyl-CoA C-acetyltransferase
MDDIVILSGARTAIGTFGGSACRHPPIDLGRHAAKAALERAGVEPGQIGHVVFGHVINTEPRDMYLSRVAAMEAGIPDTTPAMNVNRLCGSGAQAIVSAVQSWRWAMRISRWPAAPRIMSRSPYPCRRRAGARRWATSRARHDDRRAQLPLRHRAHGRHRRKRRRRAPHHPRGQDAFALESQKRAAAAIAEGRFKDQIVPVEVKVKRDMVAFDTDEHPRPPRPRRWPGCARCSRRTAR